MRECKVMFDRLREDIRCVFERDPAARTTLEVLTAYPGLHALFMHRAARWLWCHGFKWFGRMVSHLARWFTGIEIHPGARIGRRFFIDHGMGVVIGETAEIGDDCTLYHGVTLGGTTWHKGKRHPSLGNGVVIGAGAKVLGPVQVGHGARVGSNSVVVKDVPPGTTVVGVPARVAQRARPELKDHRQALAAKMGFDAYGLTKEMPDPVAEAVNGMLDHIHDMDQRLQQLTVLLERLNAGMSKELSPMGTCQVEPVDPGVADEGAGQQAAGDKDLGR